MPFVRTAVVHIRGRDIHRNHRGSGTLPPQSEERRYCLDDPHRRGLTRSPRLCGTTPAERIERVPFTVSGRWPLAPVARAALDSTRRITDREPMRAIFAAVVQRGVARPGDLNSELAVGSVAAAGRPGRCSPRSAMGCVRWPRPTPAGSCSAAARLPAPLWNARLYDCSGRFIAMPAMRAADRPALLAIPAA